MRQHIELSFLGEIPGSLCLFSVVAAAAVTGTLGLVACVALGISGLPIIRLVLIVLAVGFVWRLAALVGKNQWSSLVGYVIGLLPVLSVAIATPARHWDDFMTWLPAAEYLYIFNTLPVIGGPPSVSFHPGYPPGMPILLASWWTAAGHFISNTGVVINVLALSALSGMVISSGFGTHQTSNLGRFTRAAVCSLAVTLGNPGLTWHFVLSSLPDVLTAVSVACLAWLVVRFWIVGAAHDRAALWPAAVFGQLLGFLLALRQTGLVLAVLIAVSVISVAVVPSGWREARPWPSRWNGLLLAFAPGLSVIIAWRVYVRFWLPEAIEFFVMPIDQWNWSALPSTFASIAAFALEHWGLSLVTMTVAVYGLLYLNKKMKGLTTESGDFEEAGALACVFAVLWLLYSGFLIFCYLAAFNRNEALRAAEWLRYQTHVVEFGFVVAVVLLIRITSTPCANIHERLRRLALPVCLCLGLVANVFTRPMSADYPAVLRYAASCDCPFLRPGEVDAIASAALGVRDKLISNPPGKVIFELDLDAWGPQTLMYHMVLFGLWQQDPMRTWDVQFIWKDAPDVREKIASSSERVQFLARPAGCAIKILHKASGAWVEKTTISAPPVLVSQCNEGWANSKDTGEVP
jgi:hypothetical protein